MVPIWSRQFVSGGGVERISCTAHTLQLCVVKALQKITLYIKRFQNLSKFFNLPKQNERLEEAQRQLEYESLNNNDYNLTLDNSTSSQPSPNQVSSDFTSDQTLSEPTDEEWDLLDQLIELFKPIEEATEWLSDQKYCTLSLIFPTIQVLKYDYIIIEENSEDETEEEPEIEDIDDDTNDDTDNEVDKPKKPNIVKIIKLVKNTIYDALFKYFDSLPDSVLLASLLDPRFKKMKGWLENEKEKAIALLKSEYTLFMNEKDLNIQESNNHQNNFFEDRTINYNRNFKSCLFDDDENEIISENEVDHYLNRIRTPQAN
ncbi:4684_t:CDS:2, partial [Racocetra fulgida]